MNRGGLVLSTSFSVGHERARARKKTEQATNARGLQTARRISCFGHSLGVGVRYCNLIYRACVCVCLETAPRRAHGATSPVWLCVIETD